MSIKLETNKESSKFEILISELLVDGKDFSLQSDQEELSLYMEGGSGWCLVLTKNGKWRLE